MQHRRDVEKKTRKTVESHDTTRVHTCHGCEVAAKVPATSFRFNRRTPPTQPRAKARAFAHCREGAIPEEAVHTGTIEATSKPKALCAFPTLGRHRPAFQIRQGLNRQTDREEMLESCLKQQLQYPPNENTGHFPFIFFEYKGKKMEAWNRGTRWKYGIDRRTGRMQPENEACLSLFTHLHLRNTNSLQCTKGPQVPYF